MTKLETELREAAMLAHKVTGASLSRHVCTRAADEIERLRDWIRREGMHNNTCTYPVLGEICEGCRCGKDRLQLLR